MGVKDEQIQNKKSRNEVVVGKATRFNEAQFIQYELDVDQQRECKAWTVSESELFDDVFALIRDGYKFTLKWDSWSRSDACFMQPADPDGPNAGYILTGRGSSPFKALKQCVYKHRVCLDGEWGGYAERRGGDTIDD